MLTESLRDERHTSAHTRVMAGKTRLTLKTELEVIRSMRYHSPGDNGLICDREYSESAKSVEHLRYSRLAVCSVGQIDDKNGPYTDARFRMPLRHWGAAAARSQAGGGSE